MDKDTRRFKRVYYQNDDDSGAAIVYIYTEIWVDTVTGVNYVFHRNNQSAGFTPLLNADGTPVVEGQ